MEVVWNNSLVPLQGRPYGLIVRYAANFQVAFYYAFTCKGIIDIVLDLVEDGASGLSWHTRKHIV